jgi:hypothetical protein
MGKYYDKKVKDAPEYSVGDMVMLSAKHLKTRRPSKKLDHKMQGPFKITKVISPTAVRLELPRRWRVHNTFHVSLLEPLRISKKGLRAPPDADTVLEQIDEMEFDDDEELWEMDTILGSSCDAEGKVKYLTRWKGFPEPENWTEEPWESFAGLPSEGELRKFHRKYPQAARDRRLKIRG